MVQFARDVVSRVAVLLLISPLYSAAFAGEDYTSLTPDSVTSEDYSSLIPDAVIESLPTSSKLLNKSGSEDELFNQYFITNKSRAVYIGAVWCGQCVALKSKYLNSATKALQSKGWKIGSSATDHIQILDYDDNKAEVERLGLQDEILPCLVGLDSNEQVVRRWDRGLLDSYVLAWLATGTNYRKGNTKAPTPLKDVYKGLEYAQLKPGDRFVDYGCGDARWLIAAAEDYGCTSIGVEIDPTQVEIARRAVKDAALEDKITIIEGDAITEDVEADVGVSFLYSDVLEQLVPKIKKLKRFISYRHPVPGLQMEKYGDFYVWKAPSTTYTVPATNSGYAYYSYSYYPQYAQTNQIYQQYKTPQQLRYYVPPRPGCNCEMCRMIRAYGYYKADQLAN